MNPPEAVRVTDLEGIHGTIDTAAWPLDGSRAEVLVQLESGQQVLVPLKVLIQQDEGHYYAPMALADLERARRAGSDPREPPLVLPVIVEALDVQKRIVETGRVRIRKIVHEREELVDPPLQRDEVVVEHVQVGTRQVRRGGVRLYTQVVEEPVEQEVRLREEPVTVERRPVDRPASEADFAAATERTVEVTETDEEVVVRKQARVVEEVVVGKEQEERTETVRDTVRRTAVEVEPVGAEATREARGFATYETDFRHHYTTAAGGRGQAYEHWAPAYRYGYTLAGDPRYTGHDWPAIEADARRDWEQQHRGTWE